MITVIVKSQLVFSNDTDLENYLKHQEKSEAINFAQEIRTARETGFPVGVTTKRPEIKSFATTVVSYQED